MARIGRPPKDEGSKKSAHLSFRISTRLRDRLEAEGSKGERSLSEEIELRLWDSLNADRSIEQRFGGVGTARLLEIIAEGIMATELHAGGEHHWLDDRFVYDQVRTMINFILDHLRPSGRRVIPKSLRQRHPSLRKDVENIGRHSALVALTQLEAATKGELHREPSTVGYYRLAYPLGRRLKGSPSEELADDRWQTKQRIDHYLKSRGTTYAGRADKVALIAERFRIAISALDAYLKERLVEGATVDMANVFKGLTGKSITGKKPIIIERIKAATLGKLVDHSDIDNDVAIILDAASRYEIGDKTITTRKGARHDRRQTRRKGGQK